MNAMLDIIANNLADRLAWVRQVRRIGNVKEATLGDAELFEAFLLLSLGLQIGAIMSRDFDMVTDSIFQPFFRDLARAGESPPPGDLPQFVGQSDELRSLILRFQRFQRVIELAIRGEASGVERVSINGAGKFAGYINDGLVMYCSLVQDEGFHNYYLIIETASDLEWNALIQKTPTHEEVLAVIDDPSDRASCLYHGFLRLLRYLTVLRQITDAISGDRELDQVSATNVIERLREAFGWRVMMASYESSRRVEKLRERLIRLVSEGEPLGTEIRRELDAAIENAFGLWYVSA